MPDRADGGEVAAERLLLELDALGDEGVARGQRGEDTGPGSLVRGHDYFGGSSDAAIAVAGRHADIYALWGETRAQVRDTIARVRAAAAQHGRQVRFSVSFRPIIADTEDAAWARARRIYDEANRIRAAAGLGDGESKQSEGARRLLAAAAQGDRVDG